MSRGLALVFVASCAGGANVPPETPAPDPAEEPTPAAEEEPVVSFHLIADTDRAAPGQEITLGGRFEMEDDWHIYWINPGDSGLATTLEITAPEGFELGPIRFPGPQRFDLEGGIVNYGYSHEVALLASAIAPDPLPDGELVFRASATWLACREACIQGEATAELRLGAASAEAPASPTSTELLQRMTARLPVALPAESAPTEVTSGGQRTETFAFAGARSLEYFPHPSENPIGTAAVPADAGQALHITLAEGSPRAQGVVAVAGASGTRYYDLSIAKED